MIRTPNALPVQECSLHIGDLFPTFSGTKKSQSALLALAVPSVTLIQKHQYIKVAYFGVVRFNSHYMCGSKSQVMLLISIELLKSIISIEPMA